MDLKLDSFLYEKSLVFTVTSDGYKYLTWNLWLLLEKLRVPWKLCILCLDRESQDFFTKIAMIPSRLFIMSSKKYEHKTPCLFGSSTFKRMNRMKLKALEELSARPDIETLVFLDSDIAVFRDPLPYFLEQLQQQPLLFQCDEKEQFQCSSAGSCPNPCSGVIALQCSSKVSTVFSIQDELWKSALTDQDYILARLKETGTSYATLSRELFPNGIFLSGNRFKEGNPYLIHFNYLVGMEKVRSMKQKECWLVPV